MMSRTVTCSYPFWAKHSLAALKMACRLRNRVSSRFPGLTDSGVFTLSIVDSHYPYMLKSNLPLLVKRLHYTSFILGVDSERGVSPGFEGWIIMRALDVMA